MKNFKNWFTVMELLTVIAIIMIFAIWASSFNFNSMSDRQNLEMLSNSIISQIETVRTNALIWKWVLPESWTGLIVPKYWKIEFSKEKESDQLWSGAIITKYKIDDSSVDWQEDERTLLGEFTSISNIVCTFKDWIDEGEMWIIYFEWNKYTLGLWEDIDDAPNGCLSNFTKIDIEIQYKYEGLTEVISFNTISWLVEKVKK
jgi:hypothetical protein